MKISVIIPALNESEAIHAAISSIKTAADDVPFEIIVVDGDAAGSTIQHISDAEVIIIISPRGRAVQMNAGATRASGDVLLFLHADTVLPPKALASIVEALSDKCFIGGAFDLAIQNRRFNFRAISKAASFKHRLTRVPFGDQAIFLRRNCFDALGGYPEIPLMEDVALMKRIKQQGGRIVILSQAVKTSPRKWESEGVLYTIFRNWAVQALYLFGVPAERLVQYYYKVKL
jgi:rSAM/selenodomain-associated transferase 2